MEYKLSVNGLYEYDNTIFANFALPTVWTAERLGIPANQYVDAETVQFLTINRETLFNRIRLDSLPFSCVYASADVLKAAIGMWSESQLPRWQALYNTLFYKFNPLWNKDATFTETHTTDTDTNVNRTSSALDRTTYSSAAKDRNTDLVRSYEEGDAPVAFDPTIPHNHDIPYLNEKKISEESTKTDIGQEARETSSTVHNAPTAAGTVPANYLKNINPSIADSYEDDPTIEVNYTPAGAQNMTHQLESINSFDHAFTDNQANDEHVTENNNRREYGNIGVTSTQELIERSRTLALFNIYDIIVSDFIKYFCILVY